MDRSRHAARIPEHPRWHRGNAIGFAHALTPCAFGLAATGIIIDYGWSSFEPAIKNGTFFNVRRK